MQFSQVIGQKETKEHLVHMVQYNRLSHALLFLAKEGTGGLAMARALAQYSICEKVNGKTSVKSEPATPSLFGEPATDEPITDNQQPVTSNLLTDSCGVCPSCTKAQGMVHPDIHFSYPVIPRKSGDKPVSTDYNREWRDFTLKNPYGNSYDWLQSIDAENKQGNITAAECNDIIHKMSLKSFEAPYKILIMWMPEQLGKEGNKLLKLIEEPPPDSLFIFVAENDALILPTILSRTQLIKIPPLKRQDIEATLELKEGIAMKKAEQIAILSNGNYHEALHQLAHSDDDWDAMLREWLNCILKTGPVAQVKWIEGISKTGREKQKQFLLYFIQLLETATSLRFINQAQSDEQEGITAFAARFNRICAPEQQEAILHELDNAIYYIERNANPKMLFHALTIKLYHIISNKSVILVQ